jgi:hypothetical protein
VRVRNRRPLNTRAQFTRTIDAEVEFGVVESDYVWKLSKYLLPAAGASPGRAALDDRGRPAVRGRDVAALPGRA